MTELDQRIYLYEPQTRRAEIGLAALFPHLFSEITEWELITPREAWAGARLSLRKQPADNSPQITEALLGEELAVFGEASGEWLRVRTLHDGYLGWAKASGMVNMVSQPPMGIPIKITALRAHAFAGPKVNQPIVAELCYGSLLSMGAGECFTENHRVWQPIVLPTAQAAWVQQVTLSPVLPNPVINLDPVTNLVRGDLVDFALRFLEVPYVWGGRSAWGLDCSGLTQLVYGAFGMAIPRDADQQQAFLTPTLRPQSGDLAFFDGHVGIMLDKRRMLHANATHMKVTIETFGKGEYGKRLEQYCLGFGQFKKRSTIHKFTIYE